MEAAALVVRFGGRWRRRARGDASLISSTPPLPLHRWWWDKGGHNNNSRGGGRRRRMRHIPFSFFVESRDVGSPGGIIHIWSAHNATFSIRLSFFAGEPTFFHEKRIYVHWIFTFWRGDT